MTWDYHREPPGRRRATSASPGGRGGAGPLRWQRWAARAVVAAALAGSLGWIGVRAARAMPPWPYFRVAEVLVEGNLQMGRQDVLSALDLPPGASLLTLDLPRLGGRLAGNPWVKEATLERRLPDRLVVRLVERAPVAVLLAGGAYLVSGDGMILAEVEAEAGPGLPVLRAPAGRRYAPGERVAPDELDEALGAWRQVQLAPAFGGRWPVEVALLPDGSYQVRVEPSDLVVRLRPSGLDAQLQHLGAVLALRGGVLDEVAEVDLRFPEKVILRQRPSGPRPAAAPLVAASAGRGGAPPAGRPRGLEGSVDLRPDPDRPIGR